MLRELERQRLCWLDVCVRHSDTIQNVGRKHSRPNGLYKCTPRCPSSWTCPGNLQWKALRRYLDQMPELPQLASFNRMEQLFYSKLPEDVWTLYHISKAESGHPVKITWASWIYNLILSVTNQRPWPWVNLQVLTFCLNILYFLHCHYECNSMWTLLRGSSSLLWVHTHPVSEYVVLDNRCLKFTILCFCHHEQFHYWAQ